MPRRNVKRVRKARRKQIRQTVRRRKNRNFVKLNPRAGLPLPPRLRTTLTYCGEHVSTGGGTATLSNFQYALNSVYDPYVTAGGHQPMGFDQLMSLYQFCRVISAKVTVLGSPGTSSADNPPYIGIAFTENASFSPTSLELLAERGNVTYRMMPWASACNKAVVVKRNWSAKKWWNKTYASDQSNANTATNGPSGELCYANIFAIGPASGNTYANCYFNVRIEYQVEFYGQLQLNQS